MRGYLVIRSLATDALRARNVIALANIDNAK